MKLKRWHKITATIIAVPLLLLAYVIFLFDWNMAKGFIESKASSATGRTIKLNGDLNVEFGWDFAPKITVNNARVSNMATGTAPDMLDAGKIAVKFNLLSPFTGRLEFPYIYLDNANVLLEKDKDGNANWQFGAKKKDDDKSEPPIIGKLLINQSQLGYKDATQGTDLKVSANSARDFRAQPEGQKDEMKRNDFITLKGDGNYKKNPFHLEYNGASVLSLQNRSEPYPLKTSLNIGHTQINIEGTVIDPNSLKGLDITLNVKGANASDLFPITGIALPPTPPYDITGRLDYADKVWKFTNLKGKMGDSDLSGNLSWDTSHKRPLLTAKFVSENLNFKDLGGFIGAPPAVKSTVNLTDEQKQKIAKAAVSPYIIPDAPLDISRLASMDAKVEFTGKKVISPNLPLDNFYLNVDLDDRYLKINPVKFGTANGDISAIFGINARQEPVEIDSDFSFKKLALSRLFEKVPIGDNKFNNGYIGGTAKLKGTGKSLREMLANSNGTIGIGMEGGNLSNILVELIGLDIAETLGFLIKGDKPVPIRCVIADFDVEHGLMKSKTIIMDTTDSNIKGEGTINLGTEKMDLKLAAHPKDPSILSLRSPIVIDGTLKNPGVNIGAKELILRGGAATAAGVLLPPLAVLAFVEPGLGKDSNCAKYIGEMNHNNGNTRAESLVPKNKNAPVSATIKPTVADKPKPAPMIIKQTPPLPGSSIPGQ